VLKIKTKATIQVLSLYLTNLKKNECVQVMNMHDMNH